MIYNMMLNAADRTIQQYLQQGLQFPQDATVCVIYTGTQHIYTGISHSAMKNGVFTNFHAEITTIQNMLAGGDNFAEYIFVMGITERRILVPCNQCIQYLLSCGPNNSNCKVVLPDRTISIMNTDTLAPNMSENPVNASQPLRARPAISRSMQASVSVPVSVSAQHSNSSYLKNRVSSLMTSADEEEPEEPRKKKGFLNTLFGKG